MTYKFFALYRFCWLLILSLLSVPCFAAPRKDTDGHYMVKSVTHLLRNELVGTYYFSYNAFNEMVKVEYVSFDGSRQVLSRYGNKITYKEYNQKGKQNPEIKYEYVLDDEGQIMFVSENSMEGGSQLKFQNDYYYEDGSLVYGEYHEYHADNLTDDPHLFLDTYHSLNYDYPEGNLWVTLTQNNYNNGEWFLSKPCPVETDIEYWDIENNTNIEPSTLYFTYSPYPIAGNHLAFLAGWMKLRSQHLLCKYGGKFHRTRIEYKLDEYHRPVEAKSVPDTEFATHAHKNRCYRIEYVDE